MLVIWDSGQFYHNNKMVSGDLLLMPVEACTIQRGILNYSSMKLEFLALKWAVSEKFHEYLLGAKYVVFSDNNPLSYLQIAKLTAIEQGWAFQ